MKNVHTLKKFEGGMHYILLDKNTVSDLTMNGNKRAICRLNDQVEIHCAIMSKKEGGHFINIGSTVCNKLGIKEGSEVTATFRVDNSEYQFEMPVELKEVLDTDPEADRIFHSLTEGNQRCLMYLVTLMKSSDKRIERALKIVEKIKLGITSARAVLK